MNKHVKSQEWFKKKIKKANPLNTEGLYKKDLHNPDSHDGVITPRARQPGMGSQVGLRKHYYEQS